MYNCEICQATSEPRAPKRRHAIKRPDGNIEREMAVCEGCNNLLLSGVPLVVLFKQSGKPNKVEPVKEEAKVSSSTDGPFTQAQLASAMKPVAFRRGGSNAHR